MTGFKNTPRGKMRILLLVFLFLLLPCELIAGLMPNSFVDSLVLIGLKIDGDFDPFCTGFFVGDEKHTILVTNKHCLKNNTGKTVFVRFNRKTPGPTGDMFEEVQILPAAQARYEPRFHERVDLAVLSVQKPNSLDLEQLKAHKIADSHFLRRNDVPLGDEVFLVGFPTSVDKMKELQRQSNIPIVRGGLVSAKYEQDNLSFLLIHAPAYWGDSGSPVIIKPSKLNVSESVAGTPPKSPDNPMLIGIVSEMRRIGRKWGKMEVGDELMVPLVSFWNSGLTVVIPVDYLIELMNELP